MYGTIAKMNVKPGAVEKLTDLMVDQDREPGLVSYYIYQTDADANELYVAVLFESKEAYIANAHSPEQTQRYEQYRELLTAEPEWHDGEVIAHKE